MAVARARGGFDVWVVVVVRRIMVAIVKPSTRKPLLPLLLPNPNPNPNLPLLLLLLLLTLLGGSVDTRWIGKEEKDGTVLLRLLVLLILLLLVPPPSSTLDTTDDDLDKDDNSPPPPLPSAAAAAAAAAALAGKQVDIAGSMRCTPSAARGMVELLSKLGLIG
mmetsp:Transcript_2790/g.5313  ORF Transcript_2790/g.5313 Transcript_2790/m.5313 type:complete len:163 (+) Transcript_2790:1038-1526(+)